jgi:hypothetical protein
MSDFTPEGGPGDRPAEEIIALNPISAIEEFFEEPLGPKVLQEIRDMSDEQLFRFVPRYSHGTMVMNSYISARIAGDPMAMRFGGVSNELQTGVVHVYDRGLRAGLDSTIPDVAGLKQAALYSDRVLLRNPLPKYIKDYQDDPEAARINIVRQLGQLMPIADLIRSGCFLLVDDPMPEPGAALMDPYEMKDPYIRWLLYYHPEVRRELEELQERELGDPGAILTEAEMAAAPTWRHDSHARLKLATEALLPIYEPKISPEQLHHILGYSALVYDNYLQPIAADPILVRHMRRCTALLLEHYGSSALPLPAVAPAVRFSVPALSEVPFEDIARLRQDEKIFKEFSTALNLLAKACAGETDPENLAEYEARIKINAEGIMEEPISKLKSWQKKARHKKWASGVLGQTIGLGVDALAGGVPIGGFIGDRVGRRSGRKATHDYENAALAHSILQSFLW